MKLGYTIFYTPDVAASLTFYAAAFSLQRRFLHEGGDYGELDTGATTLAFAAHSLGAAHFQGVISKLTIAPCPDASLVELCTPMG